MLPKNTKTKAGPKFCCSRYWTNYPMQHSPERKSSSSSSGSAIVRPKREPSSFLFSACEKLKYSSPCCAAHSMLIVGWSFSRIICEAQPLNAHLHCSQNFMPARPCLNLTSNTIEDLNSPVDFQRHNGQVGTFECYPLHIIITFEWIAIQQPKYRASKTPSSRHSFCSTCFRATTGWLPLFTGTS